MNVVENVKGQKWTPEEDRKLIALAKELLINGGGGRKNFKGITWASVAEKIPGRTPEACSARYYGQLGKPQIMPVEGALDPEDPGDGYYYPPITVGDPEDNDPLLTRLKLVHGNDRIDRDFHP